MRIFRNAVVGAALLALLGAPATAGSRAPIPVSPGDAQRVAVITDRCPTFSWGLVSNAQAYQIMVFEVENEVTSPEDVQPLVWTSVVGTASAWSPAAGECLERGRRYGWSLRATKARGVTRWSRPALFEVAGGPTEEEFRDALRVVREYLGSTTEQAAPMTDGDTGSESRARESVDAATPAGQPSRIQVSNLGGGIFSETSGLGSAAVWGSNTFTPSERNRGYLAVQGWNDFDDHRFLDDSIASDEIGVLGVSPSDGGSDNFGVVGVSSSEGWGGRFFADNGAQTDVYVGSDDTAIYLKGNNQIDLRVRINNGGGDHYIFDDTTDSNAFKIESARGKDLVFNTNAATERMRLTSTGEVLIYGNVSVLGYASGTNGFVAGWANVGADGTAGSSCYRCSTSSTTRLGLGYYRVGFNFFAAARPAVASAVNGVVTVSKGGLMDESNLYVRVYDPGSGNPVDSGFSVIVF